MPVAVDGPTSWMTAIGVGDDETTDAALRPAELKKLLDRLDELSGAERSAVRAEPQGGQFALGGGRVGAKPAAQKQQRKKAAPGSVLGYNPKTGQGTGYGSKNGDSRVRGLQEALNKLGLTDANGKPLKVDGKLGPKTTAAIKKLQQQLGMTPNGRVTPLFLSKITGAESVEKLKASIQKPAAKPATRAAFARLLARHLPGKHRQDDHAGIGGRKRYTWDQFVDLYGEQVDERSLDSGEFASVHKRHGEVILAYKDGDDYRLVADGDADTARRIAAAVRDIADSADRYDKTATDATPASSNGLVDWTVVDGVLVGYTPLGEVSLRYVGDSDSDDLDEFEGLDIGADDAVELAAALDEMAEIGDEIQAAERSAFIRALGVALLPVDQVERHRPGGNDHDQSSHGRKGPAGLAKAAVKKTVKQVTDAPAKKRAPKKTVKAKPKADRFANAAKGADALAAAPHRFGDTTGQRGGFAADEIDSAIGFYRGAGYMGINDDLRKGVELKGPWAAATERLDAGMGPLGSDVEVWRAMKNPSKVFGDAWNDSDVTGLEWRDAGYSSTTTDDRLGQGTSFFSGTNGVAMRIVAPKGTRALAASDSGGEAELLLDRGLRFRVVADHGTRRGLRRLDVEVVDG